MLHGVVFAHPFGQRTGLPAEVPTWLHADRSLHVFTYGRLQSTFWCVGVDLADVSAAKAYLRPQLCNPTKERDGAYWSAWKLFTTDLILDQETLQIGNLQKELATLLADLLTECLQAVETSMNAVQGNRGGNLRERRRLLQQHKKAIAGLREINFGQVWSAQDFGAAVPEGHDLRQPVPWSKLSSGKVTAPMLALKLSNTKELHSMGLLLPALRSMVLNNVKYRICSEPVLMHAVATIGKVMTKGGLVNVYGDFKDLRQNFGLVPKNCVAWAVRLDDDRFQGIWDELKAARSSGQDLATLIARNRFRLWEIGDTFGVASASQDLQVLRVLLPEKVYDAEGKLVIPDLFETGKQIYVAFLANVEKQQFQLKSINRIQQPLNQPLLELLDCPTTSQSMIEDWFPEKNLIDLNLSTRFPSLTSDQQNVLAEILTTPKTLLSITASAGTGKSYLLGAVLRLWLDRAVKGDTASVAMVSTPRAKHREDLLRNLEVFLPTKQCFILESGPDLESKEIAINDAFFYAATGIAVDEARKEHTRRLAAMDEQASCSQQPWPERCLAVTVRTRMLWEQILWTRQDIIGKYLTDHLRVVLATSDKIRKHLANSGPFFHGRPVDILCQDEYEGESLLDFLSCAAHFPRCLCVGDPCQQLKRLSALFLEDNLPDSAQEPQEIAGQKIAPYDPPVLEFLQERSFTTKLQKTFRLGKEAVQFIEAIFPEPYKGSLVSANQHHTKLSSVEYLGHWLDLDLPLVKTSICSNFEWSLFTTVALDCLRHDPQTHVAVISFYTAVLVQFDCHLRWVAQQIGVTGDLPNIHLLTPESSTGYTVRTAHVLALQQRKDGEREPGGQQLELARRFVSFTRAKEHLWVWVQALEPASDEWTQTLQGIARNNCQINLDRDLPSAWTCLGFDFGTVDVDTLWWAWKPPSTDEYTTSLSKLRRRASFNAANAPSAAVFFSKSRAVGRILGSYELDSNGPFAARTWGIWRDEQTWEMGQQLENRCFRALHPGNTDWEDHFLRTIAVVV